MNVFTYLSPIIATVAAVAAIIAAYVTVRGHRNAWFREERRRAYVAFLAAVEEHTDNEERSHERMSAAGVALQKPKAEVDLLGPDAVSEAAQELLEQVFTLKSPQGFTSPGKTLANDDLQKALAQNADFADRHKAFKTVARKALERGK